MYNRNYLYQKFIRRQHKPKTQVRYKCWDKVIMLNLNNADKIFAAGSI